VWKPSSMPVLNAAQIKLLFSVAKQLLKSGKAPWSSHLWHIFPATLIMNKATLMCVLCPFELPFCWDFKALTLHCMIQQTPMGAPPNCAIKGNLLLLLPIHPNFEWGNYSHLFDRHPSMSCHRCRYLNYGPQPIICSQTNFVGFIEQWMWIQIRKVYM
jgi:hypothetical protein